MKKYFYIFFIIILFLSCTTAGSGGGSSSNSSENNNNSTKKIDLNQIGYYINAPKIFIACNSNKNQFTIINNIGNTVYTGNLVNEPQWNATDDSLKSGNFSDFNLPGLYKIYIEDIGFSYEFSIGSNILNEALITTLKSYYYQRCSYTLLPAYAGIYSRQAGHPDTSCTFHNSTGKNGTLFSPGGWYDAGDYGKYIVNGGITVATLLSLYELYPNLVTDNSLNIPESSNGLSDLLDEVKYELDWFKTMQDADGGVFFKIGGLSWPGFIMPVNDNIKRYIIGKSTASTLNFCACMALAGRIYQSYNADYANDCITRAENAWIWAKNNPNIIQPSETGGTGPYDDSNFSDEFFYAACELYLTTGKQIYKDYIVNNIGTPSITAAAFWGNLKNLGYFSLLKNENSANNNLDQSLKLSIKNAVINFANELIVRINANPYKIPMNKSDFVWGSNGILANYGIILAYAYIATSSQIYLDASVKTLDFNFGKNPTGYTSITGIGKKSPLHPHHRPSGADGIILPIPGLVVGGANQYQEDHVGYPSKTAGKSYIDIQDSYASNEPAINQNASVIFLIGFVTANKDIYK